MDTTQPDVPCDSHAIRQWMRRDPTTGPAHAAAGLGLIWWLERCAASSDCRRQLGVMDLRGDTPLHHCARHGRLPTCKALLRLGADPTQRNNWNLIPEHL